MAGGVGGRHLEKRASGRIGCKGNAFASCILVVQEESVSTKQSSPSAFAASVLYAREGWLND